MKKNSKKFKIIFYFYFSHLSRGQHQAHNTKSLAGGLVASYKIIYFEKRKKEKKICFCFFFHLSRGQNQALSTESLAGGLEA
jgi:hypothetical protein